MNYATRVLAVACAIHISGCAYEPKQVEASRPLVNPVTTTGQSALPADLQQALNSAPQGAAFSSSSVTYTMGQRYVSALGQECVALLSQSMSGHSQRSVACKNNDMWYLIPQLEQASVNNLLAE